MPGLCGRELTFLRMVSDTDTTKKLQAEANAASESAGILELPQIKNQRIPAETQKENYVRQHSSSLPSAAPSTSSTRRKPGAHMEHVVPHERIGRLDCSIREYPRAFGRVANEKTGVPVRRSACESRHKLPDYHRHSGSRDPGRGIHPLLFLYWIFIILFAASRRFGIDHFGYHRRFESERRKRLQISLQP